MSLRPDGLYEVSDRTGARVQGLVLTAAAEIVEAPEPCSCGCSMSEHLGAKLDGPCRTCKDGVKFTPTVDRPPGDLSAGVIRFGETVLSVVRELARR